MCSMMYRLSKNRKMIDSWRSEIHLQSCNKIKFTNKRRNCQKCKSVLGQWHLAVSSQCTVEDPVHGNAVYIESESRCFDTSYV